MHAANPVRTETPTSRRAQRVIFHFLLPPPTLIHGGLKISSFVRYSPVCLFVRVSPPPLLSSHPLATTISVFLFSFFLSFPLIVRSRTEPQEFEFHLRYIRSYLSLASFSSFFSLFLSRPFPARPRVLCAAIDDSSPEYRIYPFHHRELERDRPEIERVYIYIVSQPRKYFSPRISRLVENLCFCVVAQGKDREEGKSCQIEIIRANSANLPQLSLLEIKSKHRFEIFRGGRDDIPPGTLLFSREHDAATSLRLVICPLNWRKGGRSVGGGRGGIVSFARTGVKKKKKKKNGFLGRRNAHIIC